MRYDALRYFVEVVEQGSINKASEALYISQPNLSTAIRHLEDDFGLKLLDRTNRGIRLTENGKEIYFYAKRVFEQLEKIEKYADIHTYEYPIKLAMSINGIFLSADLFNGFYGERTHKRMEYSVREVGLEEVLQDVARLTADLGAAVVNEAQMPDFKRVVSIKGLAYDVVEEGRLLALMGPKNPLYQQETVRMDQLLELTAIRFPSDYFTELNHKFNIGGHGLGEFQSTITMNHCHSIVNLLKNSDAFLFGNRWEEDDVRGAGIRGIPVEGSTVCQQLVLVRRAAETLTPSTEAFRQNFIAHYRSIPV